MKPIDLLTKVHEENKEPLFGSQQEILQALIEKGEFVGKNDQSLRSFLNQVLNGERRLSKNLADALKGIVFDRLGKIPHHEKEMKFNEIVSALRIQYDNRNTRKELNPHNNPDYKVFSTKSNTCREIFIITPMPAEIFYNETSQQFMKTLLINLGFFHLVDKTVKYTFIFPRKEEKESQSIAFRFWNGLCNYAMNVENLSSFKEDIIKKNSGDEPLIQVFETNPALTWLHVSAFDMVMPNEKAFVLCNYEENGQKHTSIARLDGESYKSWKTYIYFPIMENIKILAEKSTTKKNLDINEVTFESVSEYVLNS